MSRVIGESPRLRASFSRSGSKRRRDYDDLSRGRAARAIDLAAPTESRAIQEARTATMSIRAVSLISRLLALASVVAFVIATWHIMGLIEDQHENAGRVADQHDALRTLLTRAEKLGNQLDTLEPNAAGDDLVAGERLTHLWNAELTRLRILADPSTALVLTDAITQLQRVDELFEQMGSANVGGKQYIVEIADVRQNVGVFRNILGQADAMLATAASDRRGAAQRARLWVLQAAAGIGTLYLVLLMTLRAVDRQIRHRVIADELTAADLEALGGEGGLSTLRQCTPHELNKMASAMSESFRSLRRNIKERSTELEQQAKRLEREVAVRRMAEEQLRHAAFHDQLTGMCNRDLLIDRLDRATERARRHKDYEFAVLFLDIDRFKEINDSLGHSIGDQLLVEAARRLEETLRSLDSLTMTECNTTARIGGDEFVVLIDGIKAPSDATAVAERLQEVLAKPFRLDEHEVFITASIGIATSELQYDSSEDLLRDADVAMYEAKDGGRARHELFNSQMHEQANRRLTLANDFRRAMDKLDFQVLYQPIVSLHAMKVCGFEALVRWQHPDRGLVSPLEFIEHAEETGQIIALGQWVLEKSCRQLMEWRRDLDLDPDFSVSVNVSKRQLSDQNLYAHIQQVLADTGVPASCLKLEITESAIVANPEKLAGVLAHLKTLGVELHMDDFGTGYSSLSQLHRLPIDLLKIDREFMVTLSGDSDYTGVVQTIVMLAHQIGMKVTVEGVEYIERIDQLKAIGCDHVQGFVYSEAVDARTAATLIDMDVRKRPSRAA